MAASSRSSRTLATGAIYIGIALFLRPQRRQDRRRSDWAMTDSLGDLPRPSTFSTTAPALGLRSSHGIPCCSPDRSSSRCRFTARSPVARLCYRLGGRRCLYVRPQINRAKIAAFTLGGFFAACGGTLGNPNLVRQRRSPQAGAYTLNSIASVVMGRHFAAWRERRAIGSVFGALILRVTPSHLQYRAAAGSCWSMGSFFWRRASLRSACCG